jgi:NAD+ kinase
MTGPAPIKRAALIARHTLPAALETMVAAAEWLEANGREPIIDQTSAEAAGVTRRWTVATRENLATRADVVMAFGGDGTLLDAARIVVHSAADAPLIGINLGRLGFLTDVGPEDLTSALEAILAGRTRVEKRMMLEGIVERPGEPSTSRLALNDIVVTRGALSRMIELDVTVDEQFVCYVKADGLIVATPTGSTAYNLSAGGPIVHPSLDALVLTPIAPHTLTHRPLVLPATARIAVRLLSEPQSDLVGTFDGQFAVPLSAGDTIRIERAPRVLRLLHTSPRTHFDMLREKLKWGNA